MKEFKTILRADGIKKVSVNGYQIDNNAFVYKSQDNTRWYVVDIKTGYSIVGGENTKKAVIEKYNSDKIQEAYKNVIGTSRYNELIKQFEGL